MKKFIFKAIGKSWKTTLVGYLLAALLAAQPLLDVTGDFSNGYAVCTYGLRLVFAAGVAMLGKYAADSSQITEYDGKANSFTTTGND